jgi:hypothetical protein
VALTFENVGVLAHAVALSDGLILETLIESRRFAVERALFSECCLVSMRRSAFHTMAVLHKFDRENFLAILRGSLTRTMRY